jgi:hypothetical protein
VFVPDKTFQLNVLCKPRSLPKNGIPERLRPYSKILNKAGEACQGKTFQLTEDFFT